MKHRRLRILGAAVATAAVLVGCTDARKERLEGARRALAALPDVEVVGNDPAGVLTLRSRSTGATTTVDLGAKSAPAPAPLGAAAASGDAAGDATGAAGSAAASAAAAAPGDAAADASEASGAPASAGTPAAAEGAAAPGEVATAATVAAANANAPTVVRDPQGRVQVIQGSGFRIERAAGAAAPGNAGNAARTRPGTAPAAGERQRQTVPVVCGAGETRTLQGVEIDVPGAGVVAERGCNLTIANVRVRSGGWGLVVNPGATVRIDDSLVEGRTGALDLYPGGNLSAWATTFRGALGRPANAPQFVDRGGNSWQ